eukprot:NODE_9006_length_358_cov_155.151815.p2 GENE.NODE_9006_length_358_cov_155.151815~~NODE_9006_length_358_cov_155.151815.p2  ORF type:complete len:51 (-),score=9.02 NODE_9006_length_358_cov_155.151815:188-340(-)
MGVVGGARQLDVARLRYHLDVLSENMNHGRGPRVHGKPAQVQPGEGVGEC